MDRIKRILQSIAINLKKLNGLSLPAVILISSFILGGFYYAAQILKQGSEESQQRVEIYQKEKIEQTKKYEEALLKWGCLSEAERKAISQYKNRPVCTVATPPKQCTDGRTYSIDDYNSYYKYCLQREDLK